MTRMGGAEPVESRWGLSLPWWSLAIGVLTTAFLVGLAFVLLVMHSLTYGFTSVLDLGSVDDPDVDRYELALAVGIGTNVFGALGLSRLTLRTRAAAWPPVLTALLIAVVTGVVATTGMLAVLGIDPLLPSTASDAGAPTESALGVAVVAAVRRLDLVAAGSAPVTTARARRR